MGLSLGVIEEANPIMRLLYNVDSLLFLSVKLGLSFLLFAMFYHIKGSKSKILRGLSILASIFYTVICIEHIYWVSLSWS
jgi:heme/copper-type cytochrome/quinol oxidase subunit 4